MTSALNCGLCCSQVGRSSEGVYEESSPYYPEYSMFDTNSDIISPDGKSEIARGQLEQVFVADDVEQATKEFEQLLDETGGEVTSLDSSHEDSHDRKKVVVNGEDILFLKTIRDDANLAVVDLFCELVAYRVIEQRFDAPVTTATLVDLGERGPALAMRYLEEDLRDVPRSPTDFTNAEDLPPLYPIELWVENFDDKARHFRIAETAHGQEVRFIDHGHALHRNRIEQFDDPSDLSLHAPNEDRVGEEPGMYGVESMQDIKHTLDRIRDTTDAQIEEFIEWAIAQLRKVDHPEIKEFLEDEGFHRRAANRILKIRRDNIYDLAKRKLT